MDRQKELLFHDGTDEFCGYNQKSGEYSFVLRTAGNLEHVFLIINGEKHEMLPVVSEEETLTAQEDTDEKEVIEFYRVAIPLKAGEKVLYHFMLSEKSGRILYYNSMGVSEQESEHYDFWMTPGFFTPDWAKGAVMYQIMVDRFCNGDKTNDVYSDEYAYIGRGVEKVDDWYQNPAVDGTRQFYGGDLQGVIEKLDYLEKIGVQVIYFNPLFVSPSNHKYDTQDYDFIDPHIGKIVFDSGELLRNGDVCNEHADRYKVRTTYQANLEASNDLFIELVEKAHAKGMKVIIDGVFNHCGSFNKWLDREKLYRENKHYEAGAFQSKESPYNNYFKFYNEEWPDNGSYEGWWGFDTLPKLNYEGSEALCEYILKIGQKWVSPPYNVDGWRLDVAADLGHSQEFNHEFWKKFRDAVKEANPEAIILAEHYGDASSWLQGDQWDTVMNYDGFMDPVTWFLTGVDKHSDNSNPGMRGDAETFVRTMQYQMTKLQNQSLLVAMNELSNHDHSRFMTRTNQMVGRIGTAGPEAASMNINTAIFKQGVVMQMTLPGAPTLYYGDEAGVCGWTDPDNRRTYPWGRENLEIMEFYREAICIHKQNQVLKTGSYIPLVYEKDVLAYGRFNQKDQIFVAVNTSREDKYVKIPVWKLGSAEEATYEKLIETYAAFYNCSRVKVQQKDGLVELVLKPETSVVYKCKKSQGTTN
ncbi:MAG: glycoside hydrolase family 13 protein [Eubacterium sp.]|nr:glycoside hydrolase family 13 protein [Eubacterium sp.]